MLKPIFQVVVRLFWPFSRCQCPEDLFNAFHRSTWHDRLWFVTFHMHLKHTIKLINFLLLACQSGFTVIINHRQKRLWQFAFFVSSTNVSHEANEKWDVQNWLNKENRGQQMWTEMEIMKIIIFSWMKYRNLSSTLDPKDEIRDHQTNNYSTDLENSFIISQFGHLYWIKHYNVITILDLWTDEIETQKKTWFQWTRTEMSMVLFRSFCIFFENHLHFGCQIHGWRQQMTMTW